MHYPRRLYEIQVLDDSDDETSSIIDTVGAELPEEQVHISVIRRLKRTGDKAGALQY